MIRTLSISRNRNKVIKEIEKKIERDRKEIEKKEKYAWRKSSMLDLKFCKKEKNIIS